MINKDEKYIISTDISTNKDSDSTVICRIYPDENSEPIIEVIEVKI